MQRLVIGLIVLGILLASWGGWYVFTSATEVNVARVQRGDIVEYVDERAKTRLPEVHHITMPFAGRVEQINLVVGQAVREGEVVAQISPTDLQIARDEAQAAVDRLTASMAENAHTDVEMSLRSQAEKFALSAGHAVAAAVQRIASSKRRKQYAYTFWEDVQKLFAKEAKTDDDLQRADVERRVTEADYEQALETWQAAKLLSAALQLLPHTIDEYVERKALTGSVLAAQKREAEARLEKAILDQQRGTITSPINGVVLQRPIYSEQYLTPGTVLMRIGRLEDLEIEADILSQDSVRIRTGSEVEIYGPAVGGDAGHGVSGIVARVYPAGFTKISSLGVEQQHVKTIVRFTDAGRSELQRRGLQLGVDYRVRVRIFTARQDNALLVPRAAMFRGPDGDWQAFVVRSRRARRQTIEVGLMNDDHAEVLSGLEDSARVILAPENSLREGSPVKAAPP
jgi:HlyD family secretion protein